MFAGLGPQQDRKNREADRKPGDRSSKIQGPVGFVAVPGRRERLLWLGTLSD
jgi:hypothetical protein